jgi:hypothetical protein
MAGAVVGGQGRSETGGRKGKRKRSKDVIHVDTKIAADVKFGKPSGFLRYVILSRFAGDEHIIHRYNRLLRVRARAYFFPDRNFTHTHIFIS